MDERFTAPEDEGGCNGRIKKISDIYPDITPADCEKALEDANFLTHYLFRTHRSLVIDLPLIYASMKRAAASGSARNITLYLTVIQRIGQDVMNNQDPATNDVVRQIAKEIAGWPKSEKAAFWKMVDEEAGKRQYDVQTPEDQAKEQAPVSSDNFGRSGASL